jgi:hypothetical protein
MTKKTNITTDLERAFYGSKEIEFSNITIDGPADGESAFKECHNIVVSNSTFNLRYPFWHNTGLKLTTSTMSDLCRAAFWYDQDVVIDTVTSNGVKALRECKNVKMVKSEFNSDEIFWKVDNINVEDSSISGPYAFFMSSNIEIRNLKFKGKYSFQYVKNLHIKDSVLDTKDAFWHAENVLVEDSVVKGEYLAWYANNITFKNCKISGTQPLCYTKGLKFIDCTFENCDLSFEYSEVEGNIIGDIVSIKNPLCGTIKLSGNTELIKDENDKSEGRFTLVK